MPSIIAQLEEKEDKREQYIFNSKAYNQELYNTD